MLPVLRDERDVLFFWLLCDLGCVRGARAISTSVGSYALSFQVLLVLDGTLRIVEHLGQEVPFGLLDGLRLLKFVQRLLSFLMSCSFLSTLLGLRLVKCIVDLPVDLLSMHVYQFAIYVPAQIIVLDALPLVAILFHSVKGASNFLFRELAVLTHSVDAHNVLNFLRREGLRLDLRPIALVSHIRSIWVVRSSLSTVLLILFVLALRLFLLC